MLSIMSSRTASTALLALTLSCSRETPPEPNVGSAGVRASDGTRRDTVGQSYYHQIEDFQVATASEGIADLLRIRQSGSLDRVRFDSAIRHIMTMSCGLHPTDHAQELDYVLNTPLEALLPLERLDQASAVGCANLVVAGKPVHGPGVVNRGSGFVAGLASDPAGLYDRNSFQLGSLSDGLLELLRIRQGSDSASFRRRLDGAIKQILVMRCGMYQSHKESIEHLRNTPLDELFPLDRLSDTATVGGCYTFVVDGNVVRRSEVD